MKARTFNFRFEALSDLMFGKMVRDEKRGDETHQQHAERTWKLKINTDKDGNCCISPFAIKNALTEAAKRLQMKVPGQGKSTFTKLFKQGVLVVDPIMLTKDGKKPIRIDDVEPQMLSVPSDGMSGSGKRVDRIFPTVHHWVGDGALMILDPKITDDVLRQHLEEVGMFIGFGSMRVGNGGINGRFKVLELKEAI